MKKTGKGESQKKVTRKALNDRHQFTMVVVGETAVGKTYRTIQEVKLYVKDNPQTGKKGRKVLMFDVNDDDYTQFPTIDPRHIKSFKQNRARRIRPIARNGQMMTLEQKRETVERIMLDFTNGLIILDDTDKYMVGAKGQTFVGLLCANRHADIDLLLVHHSIAKIPTSTWQNMSILRLHKQTDDIYRYKSRIPNYPLVRIASFIVEEQYALANYAFESDWIEEDEFVIRKSFFVYVDMRRLKIQGCTRQGFIRAAKRFIDQEESRKVRMMCLETDAKGNPRYANRMQVTFQLIKNYLRFHEESAVSPMEENERKSDDGKSEKLAA